MQIGDIVKGKPEAGERYGITRAIVERVDGDNIRIRMTGHESDTGHIGETFPVDAKYFEIVGHVKPFDRDAVITLLKTGDKSVLFDYDLRSAYLSGADLSGANLRDANLRGANLSDANLHSANLHSANLRGADLSSAYLSGADLSGANLRGANLRGANLRGANLSDAEGILSAVRFMEAHFDRNENGYIVYKTFGHYQQPNPKWDISAGSIIEENVLHDRASECGCGVNVAPLGWVEREGGRGRDIWKCVIEWAWLPGVCVPYGTDGKIRAERVRLLEIVGKVGD